METVAAHNRAIARAQSAIVEIDVAIENESVLIGRVAATDGREYGLRCRQKLGVIEVGFSTP